MTTYKEAYKSVIDFHVPNNGYVRFSACWNAIQTTVLAVAESNNVDINDAWSFNEVLRETIDRTQKQQLILLQEQMNFISKNWEEYGMSHKIEGSENLNTLKKIKSVLCQLVNDISSDNLKQSIEYKYGIISYIENPYWDIATVI